MTKMWEPKHGTDSADRPGCCSKTRQTQWTHRHGHRTSAQWQKPTTRARTEHAHTNTALRTSYCYHRWRPYRVECTGSLPTSEVKRARLVLGWGTAREDLRVLPALIALLARKPHSALSARRTAHSPWRRTLCCAIEYNYLVYASRRAASRAPARDLVAAAGVGGGGTREGVVLCD